MSPVASAFVGLLVAPTPEMSRSATLHLCLVYQPRQGIVAAATRLRFLSRGRKYG